MFKEFFSIQLVNRSSPRLQPLVRAGACLLLITALAACGGKTDDSGTELTTTNASSTTAMTISLTSEKEAGNSLIDLTGPWSGWADNESAVRFDEQAGVLRIPAPTNGQDIEFGVRRFELPLAAGNQFSLAVQSNGTGAAAILFLFDQSGNIAPAATNSDNGLAVAVDGSPVMFTAPADIAGFYLQVQSGYQATTEATLSAMLTSLDNGSTPGEELLALDGSWLHWDGSEGDVSYEEASARLKIEPPNVGEGNSYGARRIGIALESGQTYQLGVNESTNSQSAVLLFLLGSDDQVIPFVTGDTTMPWLTATMGNAKSFVAPDGVADIGIQVQSGFQATDVGYLVPSLTGRSANGGGEQPDPALAERNAFQQMLVGRRAFPCQSTGSASFPSAQFVDTYTSDYYVEDVYTYRTQDCSGVPFSDYLPASVKSYSLGDKITTSDNREAFEIDYEQLVVGNSGGQDISDPVGTTIFDIVALDQGDVIYGTGVFVFTEAERPTELVEPSDPSMQVIGPMGEADLSVSDIQGIWVTPCGETFPTTGRVWTYSETTVSVRQTRFKDESCTDSWYTFETQWDVTYGDTMPGKLGDHQMPYSTTVTSAAFINLEIGGDAPTPPALLDVGKTSFETLSLVDGILLQGECLFFSPCARDEASRHDIIDLFGAGRARREDSAIAKN